MNKVQGILVLGTFAAAIASAHAGSVASECTAGMHLGQRVQTPAAAVASLQERLDEYLELHARAVEANGRQPLGAWPKAPSETN
jgi:hypothetical protein